MRASSLLAITLALIHLGQAANHYCVGNNSLTILEMNVDADRLETLRTSHRGADRLVSLQRCGWDVQLGRMTEPVQLVLRLRLSGPQSAPDGCPSELRVTQLESGFSKVWLNGTSLPRSPLIVPAFSSSQQLWVRFHTGALDPNSSCSRIELTIEVARKGFCGRNLLLHRSRCLLVSDTDLSLADLDGSGAELAAISDREQLRELVRANEHRKDEHPYVKPLDLSSSFTVVVHRCAASGIREYFKTSHDSCATRPFNSSGFLISGESERSASPGSKACAVLTAASGGDFRLEFRDCSTGGRSLLSFSEVPLAKGRGADGGCDSSVSSVCDSQEAPEIDGDWQIVILAAALLASMWFAAVCGFVAAPCLKRLREASDCLTHRAPNQEDADVELQSLARPDPQGATSQLVNLPIALLVETECRPE